MAALAALIGLVGAPSATAVATYDVTVTALTSSGWPVPNELASIDADGSWIASGYTQADGRVTLEGIAPGDYTVVLSSFYGTGEFYSQDISVSDGPVSVTITEQHLARVTGTVRDALTGAAVPSATVTAYDTSVGISSTFTTNGAGGFSSFLHAGDYTTSASAEGYRADGPGTALAVHDGVDLSGISLRIYAREFIAGRVTLGGKGYAAPVVVGNQWSYPSESGLFKTDVEPGTYAPYIAGDGSMYFTTYYGSTARKPDAKKITIARGRSATANIALVAAARISGTVVDRKGHAAAYVTVQAQNRDRTGKASTTTDGRGRYTLTGLASGKVDLVVWGGTDALPASGRRTVTATQGTTTKAVKVTLSDDAIIYGQIKVSGSKVTKQDVTLTTADGQWRGTFRPDAQGWVGFAGVRAGTFYVHVDGSNIRKKVVVKAHKAVSFGTITRGKQVTVKGVVKTAAGTPAKSALVIVADSYGMVYAKTRTNSHGAYSIKAAVSGRYTISASPKSGTDAATVARVTVKKGKALTKNLRFAKGATVTGVVLNSKGKPAIGVRVESFDGHKATTDKSGKYTLTGLRAGKTTLWIHDPSYVGGYRDGAVGVTPKAGKTVKAKSAAVR
ncbi:MAG: carboxypeptidase regulatory-like domain-containing protein [Brevundimonas sp.]